MYVQRVVLKHIKGFEDLDLDFAPTSVFPGWSVITGDNGAGKTALLRAISLALMGPEAARALQLDYTGWVTEGAQEGIISVQVRREKEVDNTAKGGAPVQGAFWAEVSIRQDDSGAWDLRSTNQLGSKKKKSAGNGPWAGSTNGWFGLAYGPFRRMYGTSPDASRIMALPGRAPRYATLFLEEATLGEGEQWLSLLQYRKLEDSSEDAAALDAVLALLRDDFLRRGVQLEEINSKGLWLRDSAGRLMPLRDMSDGYRSALAMLLDICRHMLAVYGTMGFTDETIDGHRFVIPPGVVIIDEVDAHLHPAWQRELGHWLTRHFPNVQFIVTTHSPLICSAADNGRVYHLPQPTQGAAFRLSDQDYQSIVAGKPDEILLSPAFELFQLHSIRAVEKRRRRAQLLSKSSSTELSRNEQEELGQLDMFANVET
jgi:predicted ATPase